VPSHEDEPTRGVAVPGDFRPRLTSLPVPQSALSRCLAASWHVDAAPALVNLEGSSSYFLSGLNHAASALAVYASQPASRQDHARLACQLVANLCCAGLVTRRVTFEVSTHVSSSAKLAWRNDHQKSSRSLSGDRAARGKQLPDRGSRSAHAGSALACRCASPLSTLGARTAPHASPLSTLGARTAPHASPLSTLGARTAPHALAPRAR